MSFLEVILLTLAVAHSALSQDIQADPIPGGLSGNGITTRYWDCCKPSCAWADLVPEAPQPVRTCEADGVTTISPQAGSGCDDTGAGSAYTCNDQQPWAINDTFSLGFAALSVTGGVDFSQCCTCMLLSFLGELQGKQMLVQVTNTGGPLGEHHFDIEMPGGGVGIFPYGCAAQWGADPEHGWGEQYGGVTSESECSQLPEQLQAGCVWRFHFLRDVSNPDVTFYQVKCPQELINISGCSLE